MMISIENAAVGILINSAILPILIVVTLEMVVSSQLVESYVVVAS